MLLEDCDRRLQLLNRNHKLFFFQTESGRALLDELFYDQWYLVSEYDYLLPIEGAFFPFSSQYYRQYSDVTVIIQ